MNRGCDALLAAVQGFKAQIFRGILVLAVLHLTGCAHPQPAASRRFVYPADAFSFTNQTHWVYGVDPATGRQTHINREPKPDYALHCFPMARAAREFFWHARFDPDAPPLDEAGYRNLVRAVIGRSARTPSLDERKVVIPGYASLAAFSREHESLLKANCGSAAQSYWQCGNWRMIFPFSRSGQANEARELLEEIRAGKPAVVHLVCFPALTLNHAVLLFDAYDDEAAIRFQVYDPNTAGSTLTLTFDKATRRFHFPATHYFLGGPVNTYEVFSGFCY